MVAVHEHHGRPDVYACPVCDDPRREERAQLVLGLTLFLGFLAFVGGCVALLWALE